MKFKRILFVMDSITSLILIHKLILILLTFSLISSGLINVNCNIIKNTSQLKFNQSFNNELNNNKLINFSNNKNNEEQEFQIFNDNDKNINLVTIKNHNKNVKKLKNNKIISIKTLIDKNIKFKNINNNDYDLFQLNNNNNNDDDDPIQNLTISNDGLKILQNFLLEYVQNTLIQTSIELLSINLDNDNNNNENEIELKRNAGSRSSSSSSSSISTDLNQESFDIFEKELYEYVDKKNIPNVNVPRAMETGRLFLFKGLKKLLWPLFIGVQIAKSILLALFLPSILGSLGKMVGKGLTQISGFNHPSETVSDLEFKDTVYSLDDDYSYPRPEASNNHFHTQAYQGATDNLQNNNNGGNTLSRFGYGDQKLTFINNNNGIELSGKNPSNIEIINSKSNILNENKNVFKDFLKVPASSLLLSNYDPFYSPLLSRIDSVFSQFGLINNNNNNEDCRSKLICLMYSNPAKYAPYSNLVSAQLSRELNELRKPTTDNDEILRFFKYMHAAKDGQDGVNCDKTYELCTDLKDSETPVMITTFNDINKLVQARKFIK